MNNLLFLKYIRALFLVLIFSLYNTRTNIDLVYNNILTCLVKQRNVNILDRCNVPNIKP